MQSVLEAKYLAGQEVFRFEVNVPQKVVPLVMLMNFRTMQLLSLADGQTWPIKRRPANGDSWTEQ